MNRPMTGKEAWDLVAPFLAAHIVNSSPGQKDELNEAYVTVFAALKEMDAKGKRNEQEEMD